MTKADQRDLFPGALEMMILHSVRRRPLHGYALVQEIKRASELQIEEGSVYPALQRMLRVGWLKAESGVSETRRKVRLYRLTDKGRKHLEEEVSSFERMYRAIARVLSPARS
jgi:transcriptional regulator, Acidobacterial, PadR-family